MKLTSKRILNPIRIVLLGSAISFGLSSCSKTVIYDAPKALNETYTEGLSANKRLALDFVESIGEDNQQMQSLLDESFVSHDQVWAGTKGEFIENQGTAGELGNIEPIRILQYGPLVAIHSRVKGITPKFRWDVLRIKDQLIEEHWSNMNDSIGLNPDGHSEIDGPTIPEQHSLTDTNRALVAQFIDQCMTREDGGASKFFTFRYYIQHNRDVGDGLSGLLWGMLKMKMKGETIKFKHNYHVIAEGNLVLSCTEGYVADQKTVFYDLFRIEDSQIVEHWDIIAPVNQFIYHSEDN